MKKKSQKIASNVLIFISIFILTAPVVIFGINDDYEVYQVGTFSNQIINQNINKHIKESVLSFNKDQ